eukprot:1873323-Pyramimonas_sp.AAC.1
MGANHRQEESIYREWEPIIDRERVYTNRVSTSPLAKGSGKAKRARYLGFPSQACMPMHYMHICLYAGARLVQETYTLTILQDK